MNENIRSTLLALKDVQGIQGSFVLNGKGALLAMEMPSLFDPSMFVELGPRVERLAESFASLGEELETCLIRFADHLLCIKQFAKGGALCILSSRTVNLPALKMATNLAHRRLATEVATVEPMATAVAPAAVNGSVVAPLVQPSPPAVPGIQARKTPRMYRGHPVDD